MDSPGNFGLGMGCVVIAILFFGSNFVVTKKYKTGDGMFFQWVMCMAVWIMGLFCYITECSIAGQCPTFEPFSMLGGVLWCLGNVWVVSIVKSIGLGLGLCIWGTTNMVVGWACGRFGILGPNPSPPHNPAENSTGVVVCVVALVIFLFIKPTLEKAGGASDSADDRLANAKAGQLTDDDGFGGLYSGGGGKARLLGGGGESVNYGEPVTSGAAGSGEKEDSGGQDEERSFVDGFSPFIKTIFGISMAVISGLFYGVNFNPPQYVVDHPNEFKGTPTKLIDHVFPHFSGILLTSTAFFIIYAAASRNAPKLYPEIVLPGMASGAFWAIAQISWFIANQNLSQALAFPLISVGPGFVGALWSVFVFGEIKGRRNYVLLVSAFVVAIAGAVLITLSTESNMPLW